MTGPLWKGCVSSGRIPSARGREAPRVGTLVLWNSESLLVQQNTGSSKTTHHFCNFIMLFSNRANGPLDISLNENIFSAGSTGKRNLCGVYHPEPVEKFWNGLERSVWKWNNSFFNYYCHINVPLSNWHLVTSRWVHNFNYESFWQTAVM